METERYFESIESGPVWVDDADGTTRPQRIAEDVGVEIYRELFGSGVLSDHLMHFRAKPKRKLKELRNAGFKGLRKRLRSAIAFAMSGPVNGSIAMRAWHTVTAGQMAEDLSDMQQVDAFYDDIFSRFSLEELTFPGTVDHVRRVTKQGIWCVCSSSHNREIAAWLRRIGLGDEPNIRISSTRYQEAPALRDIQLPQLEVLTYGAAQKSQELDAFIGSDATVVGGMGNSKRDAGIHERIVSDGIRVMVGRNAKFVVRSEGKGFTVHDTVEEYERADPSMRILITNEAYDGLEDIGAYDESRFA